MCGHVGLGRVSGEVRKNPREPATPRGSAKKKTNRRTGWSSVVVELGGFEPPSASLFRAVLHV